MANSNFVVHNGLTVGPLTIDAATGDINTPGNVNISGNIGVSSIQRGDSSIAITDTGSNSTVVITIDGTNRSNINTSGMALTGLLNVSGNISGATLTGSLLNVSGNVLASSMTANVISVSATSGLTINGQIAATLADATALAIALGG